MTRLYNRRNFIWFLAKALATLLLQSAHTCSGNQSASCSWERAAFVPWVQRQGGEPACHLITVPGLITNGSITQLPIRPHSLHRNSYARCIRINRTSQCQPAKWHTLGRLMNGSLMYSYRNNWQNLVVPKFWSPVGIYEECERIDTVLSS